MRAFTSRIKLSAIPLTYLANAKDVAIHIAAGVHDGHQGSVPIRQSIDAFNEIAKANGSAVVSEQEIEELSRVNGRLQNPQTGDEGFDESFRRDYQMRRESNKARLTIFAGGHEGIGSATMTWFEQHL